LVRACGSYPQSRGFESLPRYHPFRMMLIESLRKLFLDSSLVGQGDSILVAFSGGPDSTALLHALISIREEFELTLSAAHLNHGLRGPESDADQLFCFQFCNALDIPFLSRKVDLSESEPGQSSNLEERARESRYEFLNEAAKEMGADIIATAHTADDQVETVLLRLLRGAGLSGIRGIPMQRHNIIRPLLNVEKSEIQAYLKEHNLHTRHDSHNDDPSFSRVFLRKKVIPLLKELNPSIAANISSSADIWGQEDNLLEELASELNRNFLTRPSDDTLALGTEELKSVHIALQRRMIRRVFLMLHGDTRALESRHIDSVIDHAMGRIPGLTIKGINILVKDGLLCFSQAVEKTEETGFRTSTTVPSQVTIEETGKSYIISTFSKPVNFLVREQSTPERALLDADKVGDNLIVRSWLPGDKYQQTGVEGTQKLQDIFVNAKLSGTEKQSRSVFETNGDIIWVEGFRVSERYKVSESTRRVLLIEKEDHDETSH
jgi:tRNA(Ile)-lysidine synthase